LPWRVCDWLSSPWCMKASLVNKESKSKTKRDQQRGAL
jgi:hypothetical protein